ncbi:MAG: response regulator [Chitinivibrionales bacterium]|nr:response regulator [Chitinivibrionales bacterium]
MPKVKHPRLFFIEDDEDALFGYERYFAKAGYATLAATTLQEAKTIAGRESFDVAILDLKLPDGNGLSWLPELKSRHPAVPVIIITALGDIPTAVEATKKGAANFLTKPVSLRELKDQIRQLSELRNLRRQNLIRQRTHKQEQPWLGHDGPMRQLMEYCTVASANDTVILLLGETGTGKGVLARWIHEHSERASEPYIELNCSSLRGELLRSELFGHVKGSFTSAIKDREGLVEVADGGTLFLDEIGDMDLEVQAQLLKTIEERSFRRVGENKLRTSDFRLICATNRDLLKAAENGLFRKDLYYRICVFPIQVPPLRDRPQDISPLAHHLLAVLGYSAFQLDPEVQEILQAYQWPGNVRELRNMLERALLLAGQDRLAARHFPGLSPSIAAGGNNLKLPLEEVEKKHIFAVIDYCGGDKNKACEILGISLSALYRRLDKFSGN